MDIRELQRLKKQFDTARGWNNSRASNIFTHLIEEVGEIGRFINFEENYKSENVGNNPNINKEELQKEFAQSLLLLTQLANHYDVDLEHALKTELHHAEQRCPVSQNS